MTHKEAIRDLNTIKEFFEQESGAYPVSLEYAIGVLKNTLEEVPSADRPQGEWIDAEIPLESGDTMPIQVCNLCKTFYPLAYTGGGHRFCPNCGAKMDGEREGE